MPTIQMPSDKLMAAIAACIDVLGPHCKTRGEVQLVLLHATAAALDGLAPNDVCTYLLEITKLLDNRDAVREALVRRGLS